MARWSLFRSGKNQMRPLAITGIEETSGSIVMAAVETTCASTSTRPVKVRRGRASGVPADYRVLTDGNSSRMPACPKSDIFRDPTIALLFAADVVWPTSPVAQAVAGASYDQPVIRIRSDRHLPERVVLDTSQPTIAAPVTRTALEPYETTKRI